MPKASDHAFSENYKRKSNGVDKRVLRAYRKSVDRKQLRDEALSKRRHLDVLYETTIGGMTSPVAIRATATTSEDSKETDGSSMFIVHCWVCAKRELANGYNHHIGLQWSNGLGNTICCIGLHRINFL